MLFVQILMYCAVYGNHERELFSRTTRRLRLKIFTNKYFEYILSVILLLPVSISFILNPLTNDARIYQGVAKLTDYFGPFPANIDIAWEIKPIANRLINYILYKLGSIFANFGTSEYEIIIKVFTLVIVFSICLYFASKFENKYIFLLAALAFLTPLNFIVLQAEWWAVLFSLLAIGLFMTEKPSNHFLAGLVITIIFLFKGITILLILPIICALYLLKPDIFNRLKYGLLGSVLSLGFILTLEYFPHIIPDMILSAQIAKVGYYDLPTMMNGMINNMMNAYLFIPIIIAGISAAFFIFYLYMQEMKLNKTIVFITMWLTTLMMVFIQSEFFTYHFVVLIIPSIISIILLPKNINRLLLVIPILIIFFAITSHWSIGMAVENQFWEDKNQESVNIINNFTDIKNQSSILYYDPGDAPYYFQSNSSCRYISPLPFQRSSDTWDLSNTQSYKETYECIINYDGKYIITDTGNWTIRNTTDNKNVSDIIKTNYKQVWNRGWNIYINKNSYDYFGREVK